jgi:2-polyprenyl-3-methyl-5-hydroxy-6-metoxy-1,4-benzoquinol methylase
LMDDQEILATLKEHVARHFDGDTEEEAAVSNSSYVDQSRMELLSADVWNQRNVVGVLNPRNAGLLNRLLQALKKLVQRSLGWHTRSLQAFHASVANALEEHGRAMVSIQNQIIRLQNQIIRLQNESPGLSAVRDAIGTADLAVQEQQAPYAPLFHGLSPVVDLGCGRGEFLQLLKTIGIMAHGVDSDRRACEAARRKGLNVVHSDMFHYLQQLPNRSLGGIFSARVLEYLAPDLQVELISLCAAKLKPRGIVVIETVNPYSQFGFGRTSHIDASHVRPMYPEVLKALLESNSFQQCRIYFLAPQKAILGGAANGPLDELDASATTSPRSTAGLLDVQAYAVIGSHC